MIGYARVSTQDQDLSDQRERLRDAGCTYVYEEKMSGADGDRPQLKRMLRGLQHGQILLVTKLDRLARSMIDLFQIVETIRKAGAHFRVMDQPYLDTTTPHGRLMLGVLGSFAEFERELILERTNAGRVRAKAKGVKFGRPAKLTSFQCAEMFQRFQAGEPYDILASAYNVSHNTVWRMIQAEKRKQPQAAPALETVAAE